MINSATSYLALRYKPSSDLYKCTRENSCRNKPKFPIVLGYINKISWSGGDSTMESIMLPGYSKKVIIPYNFLVFTFWMGEPDTDGWYCTSSAALWENPIKHFWDPKIQKVLGMSWQDSHIKKNTT